MFGHISLIITNLDQRTKANTFNGFCKTGTLEHIYLDRVIMA